MSKSIKIKCFIVLSQLVLLYVKLSCNTLEKTSDITLLAAYVQKLHENHEEPYLSPILVNNELDYEYTLYDTLPLQMDGIEIEKEKILTFKILDIPMLVANQIVIITDVPKTIVHCSFNDEKIPNAQVFYDSIRSKLPVEPVNTYAFNLVKVLHVVDDSFIPVSGEKVVMKIYQLPPIDDVSILRFVIQLNGNDKPPFIVFTSTNSGIYNLPTGEMMLLIWEGLFNTEALNVHSYVIKFEPGELGLFTFTYGHKFDSRLSTSIAKIFNDKLKENGFDSSNMMSRI